MEQDGALHSVSWERGEQGASQRSSSRDGEQGIAMLEQLMVSGTLALLPDAKSVAALLAP